MNMGSPTEREARRQIHVKIHGGRSMPEAVLYTTGKPDNAGGPQPRFYVDMEGGLGRRPYSSYMGSPTEREGH